MLRDLYKYFSIKSIKPSSSRKVQLQKSEDKHTAKPVFVSVILLIFFIFSLNLSIDILDGYIPV